MCCWYQLSRIGKHLQVNMSDGAVCNIQRSNRIGHPQTTREKLVEIAERLFILFQALGFGQEFGD